MQEDAVRRLGPTGLLLGVTAIWGWTFLIVKDAVHSYPVPTFLALRFVLAAILLAPLTFGRLSRRDLKIGLWIGIPLAAGYWFQTVGLKTTSAANAGLLTGLFVIFTPILDRVIYRTALAPITLAAAVVGLCGTACLTLTGSHGLTVGDVFEILTAVAFALQLVWLGRYAPGGSSAQLAFGQLSTAAIIFTLVAALGGAPSLLSTPRSVWLAVLITGALASALAFWIQTFVQQRIPPARTAIILLGEPVFAAAFAVWLGGEHLQPIQWFGAALILLSLLLHEVWIANRPARPNQAAWTGTEI